MIILDKAPVRLILVLRRFMNKNKILFISSVFIPAGSFLVALVAVITPFLIQNINNNTQIKLKQYEVTYLEKQKLYASFMQNLTNAYYDTGSNDIYQLVKDKDNIVSIYYGLEPFLEEDTRTTTWNTILQYFVFLDYASNNKSKIDETAGTFMSYRDDLRGKLYPKLFSGLLQKGL